MAAGRHSFDAQVRRRRRRQRRTQGYLRFFACAAAILIVSLGITKLIEFSTKNTAPDSASSTSVAAALFAPLPMQGETGGIVSAEYGPVQQAGGYTVTAYNKDVIRLAERGQVSLDYFSDAAFLGDSLTEGFTEYNINLSGALICGYVGIGPDTIVNRTTVSHPQRGSEVVLDLLSQQKPKKLYVLLGTNTLVTTGTDDKFLAYYGQMLDSLRAALGDDARIYVQSIPPVRPEVVAEKPGLESSHLQTINESLAQLAAQKGCYYIDLWQALADADGNLSADLAADDGIHLSAGNGYTAWVNYLRTHTVYAADNEWTPGTAFAAGGAAQ